MHTWPVDTVGAVMSSRSNSKTSLCQHGLLAGHSCTHRTEGSTDYSCSLVCCCCCRSFMSQPYLSPPFPWASDSHVAAFGKLASRKYRTGAQQSCHEVPAC
jgi:hypothetical protein